MNSIYKKVYSYFLLIPGMLIYFTLFLLPTLAAFFFSFTWWTFTEWKFVGFDNYITFLTEPSLNIGFRNTLVYAVTASSLKVILGFLLGVFLCLELRTRNFLRSMIFFPYILSTVAVGITFTSLMHPTQGLINKFFNVIGLKGLDWLGNPKIALFSVILVDVWKGVGVATIIYIAGIMAIPREYYEALMIDGGNLWAQIRYLTLPLSRPAMNSVIILSFIDGLRRFDFIWTMTQGGPGFSTDVIASIIYKQYEAGFYGLSTAGNVILFLIVAILSFPLYRFLGRKEGEL